MKKYIKPCIEEIAVETLSPIVDSGNMGLYPTTGDPDVGQLSIRPDFYIEDDDDDIW